MGYNETWTQLRSILATQQVDYVDSLLVHWPTSTSNSSDPACNYGEPGYDAKVCRLHTWKAMVDIYNSGLSRTIGVSNYNSSHIREIIDAGYPLPSINQIPIHLYRSSTQEDTISFCRAHNILVNAYSPLAVPDWHVFPTSNGMSPKALDDPALANVARAHNRTPAQIIQAWLWSQKIITNPRTVQPAHMVCIDYR